uniref:NF-kappa-B-activating protein C-terminal domain-containing protein n=1 Tax=Chromera velia CCMP2878 TaxID=1169474 RepID=A0A0G4I6Q0_9ALVE|eukprot:Cvel_11457.t1-p1 / transcript=Cvel_11457.t1 / gene=Cvel_11457 / organism=Chromera_velia_CCMP2878 / gene_product=NF-kappa-B-activating protein, putative / transcript_product=NF-kappa-B-activating protein, putative / location=Cvel_scaffold721:7090-12442(-) / protein_length=598 / sequence_SO=supercontig / SO=protein_coding / is_pseudo=false
MSSDEERGNRHRGRGSPRYDREDDRDRDMGRNGRRGSPRYTLRDDPRDEDPRRSGRGDYDRRRLSPRRDERGRGRRGSRSRSRSPRGGRDDRGRGGGRDRDGYSRGSNGFSRGGGGGGWGGDRRDRDRGPMWGGERNRGGSDDEDERDGREMYKGVDLLRPPVRGLNKDSSKADWERFENWLRLRHEKRMCCSFDFYSIWRKSPETERKREKDGGAAAAAGGGSRQSAGGRGNAEGAEDESAPALFLRPADQTQSAAEIREMQKERDQKIAEEARKKEKEQDGSSDSSSSADEGSDDDRESKKRKRAKKDKGGKRGRKEKRKKNKKTSKKKKRSGKKNRKQSDSSDDDDSSSDSSASASNSDDDRRKKRPKSLPDEMEIQKNGHMNGEANGTKMADEDAGEDEEIQFVEKAVPVPDVVAEAMGLDEDDSEDDDVGPKPLETVKMLQNKDVNYGGALRPGEGEAIAAYVQAGKRIPRRGEVGLTADEIESFENLGYVMSGSRHRRMNAIRMRKENQVYSAEEKRALAMYNYEEKANRESALITDLKDLLKKQNEMIYEEQQGAKSREKLRGGGQKEEDEGEGGASSSSSSSSASASAAS